MNTGLYFAVALACTAMCFVFGMEACARADTAGPNDPGMAPCILSIDWTTQRQPPAVYAPQQVADILPPPEPIGTDISVTPLPHPFSAEYRAACDGAHRDLFGFAPGEFISPTGIAELVKQHRASEKYRRLPPPSRYARDQAHDLMADRWGEFEAAAIRPIHVQALYDSLSDRPATTNRRLDDISAVFSWGRTRGFADVNPCRKIERVDSESSYEPWSEEQLQTLI